MKLQKINCEQNPFGNSRVPVEIYYDVDSRTNIIMVLQTFQIINWMFEEL